MQKYFIDKESMNQNIITGSDIFHIKNVMRFKVGDKIIVSDSINEYLASISSIDKLGVTFKKIEAIDNNNELPFLIDLYQGYPKSDKLDNICKHSTELGVSSVTAVLMKRSIVKIDSKKEKTKIERYSKIMKEASEQSNRKVKALFNGISKLKEIDFANYDKLILAYEESAKNNELSKFKEIVKSLNKNDKVAILVGPEGGIDIDEVKYLKDLGFICCGLGKRILRTETASLYALSCFSYESELI